MVAATSMVEVDEELVGVAPEVKDRLAAYFADVVSALGRSEQRRAAELYARGLIEAGARKSLEPIVTRLGGGKVEYEALQHFLADSPWDPAIVDRAVAERVCAVIEPEAWVLDDTGIPKDGKRSPGVKRQYSGTLGKIGNCQIAVSLHAVGGKGTVPLGFRLYLPEDWCADAERRKRAKIPESVEFATKPALGGDALSDLAKRLDGAWHVETSSVFEQPHTIRVGFLSRLALSNAQQVQRFPEHLAPVQVDDQGTTINGMPRGALRVRVTSDGRPLDLVTCHLKSKLLSFPDGRFQPRDEGERARFGAYALDRRAAEAVTVRAAADALLNGHGDERAVIVLGDLNDEPLAATTQILLGPPGSEIGTPGFERPDRGDPMRLWNLAPRIPEQQRYTRVFRGRKELIDHILVSHALVYQVTDVDTGEVQPSSIGDVPAARRDEPASDHAPVIARFDLE